MVLKGASSLELSPILEQLSPGPATSRRLINIFYRSLWWREWSRALYSFASLGTIALSSAGV